MSRYAQGTDVPTERSVAEIAGTLKRYGAVQFAYGWEHSRAVIGFRCRGRSIRFELPLPDKTKFKSTPTGRARRSPQQTENAYEKACRQLWRALALIIKAKLEAVESDIATFEEEFLAYIILPGGETIGQAIIPKIGDLRGTRDIQRLLLPSPD